MSEMSADQLRDVVKTTIIDVLDIDENTAITDKTVADDIAGWDSLQHVRIMLALERKLNFRWQEDEIGGLKNVGDLVKKISQKVAGKA